MTSRGGGETRHRTITGKSEVLSVKCMQSQPDKSFRGCFFGKRGRLMGRLQLRGTGTRVVISGSGTAANQRPRAPSKVEVADEVVAP